MHKNDIYYVVLLICGAKYFVMMTLRNAPKRVRGQWYVCEDIFTIVCECSRFMCK